METYITHRNKVTPAIGEGLFGGRGRFRRWTYYGEAAAPAFTVIAETEMAPGASAGLHTQPDQQELLYILEGRGRFTLDGRVSRVKPGDAILARAGSHFALANPAKKPLRYLVLKCRLPAA